MELFQVKVWNRRVWLESFLLNLGLELDRSGEQLIG